MEYNSYTENSSKSWGKIDPALRETRKTSSPLFHFFEYTASSFKESESSSLPLLTSLIPKKGVLWIDIGGPLTNQTLEKVRGSFELHPLLVEDLVFEQRAKIDDYGDHLFVVLPILSLNPITQSIENQQVGIILGKHYVLSFSNTFSYLYKPLREKIKGGSRRIRNQGADYLMYTIADVLLDHSFNSLSLMVDRFEAIEKLPLDQQNKQTLEQIDRVKQETAKLRRGLIPIRDVFHKMKTLESDLIHRQTQAFLSDIHDNLLRAVEMVESLRESSSGMLEIHLLMLNQKMSEVMKVLALVAALFTPLTFLSSVYGMNFHNMPELRQDWGYPLFWVVIFLSTILMLYYFKRKGWLGG